VGDAGLSEFTDDRDEREAEKRRWVRTNVGVTGEAMSVWSSILWSWSWSSSSSFLFSSASCGSRSGLSPGDMRADGAGAGVGVGVGDTAKGRAGTSSVDVWTCSNVVVVVVMWMRLAVWVM
jgi:hypothetical protein